MKFLFDENLSFRLAEQLSDIAPGSSHVRLVGMESSSDPEVWQYAMDHNLVIVSKDVDMHDRSLLYGTPPKVVWLRIGNCSTAQIEDLLRKEIDLIKLFVEDDSVSLLPLP